MPLHDDPPKPSDTESRETQAVNASTLFTFRPGDLIAARFRIVRFIAAGGMGELYEAEDLELHEQVALKTIRADIAADEQMNQRFRREVQLARKITHPNICRIFDLFQHQPASHAGRTPTVFVTMELLEGETLAALLERKGPLTVDEAAPIVSQMTAALAALHDVGIVHRDFKTKNVMILRADRAPTPPRVVVTDFGLAYSLSDTTVGGHSISVAGQIIGTPDYMAPEQIQGGAVTPATDVYALGLVVYEMVTGVRPFAADTPVASALRRVSGPPPRSPRQLVPDLPSSWDTGIMRCLRREAANRFPDAASAAAVFATNEDGARLRASRRKFVLAAVVLLCCIVGALGWLEWRSKPERGASRVTAPSDAVPRPAVAVLGFRNLTGREDVQWMSLALAEMVTTELTASEALRTIPGDNINRMKMELTIADADSFGNETLTRIKQNLSTDFLVYGSYVIIGDGGAKTLRLDVRLQDSRDGRIVAAFGETGKADDFLDVVSAVGAKLRERLGVELKADSIASIRASEPASPEAARLYAEGLMHLRRFDAPAARELFEHAIQVDPGFPLAYSALANTWSALGYDDRARQAAERAFERSAGLPRADRLQVEGTYREMAKSWKEAIMVWRTLASLFPDDIEHTLRLTNVQIASGAPKDGLATIESFRKRFPESKDPRLDLAAAAAAETLSDFKRMQALAASAAASAETQGARLLVAMAKLRQGGALLRQGQAAQAASLFEEARQLYASAGDQVGVARALNNAATAVFDGPDPQRPITMYEEGLAIARTIGNQDLTARFLNNIAIQHRRAGDLQASLRMNQESLAIRREIGDKTNAAVSLNNIGNVLLDLGDLKGASEHYEESAAMSREIGDRQGFARALYNAAESLKLHGQLSRAHDTNEEALKIRRSIAEPAGIGSSLTSVGDIATLQGDLATAKRSLTESLEINRGLRLVRPIAYSLYYLGQLALMEGDLDGAQRQHQEALELRTQLREKGTAAESRVALATIALERGQAANAESLAREAAAAFEEQHAPDNEAMARATVALTLLAQGRADAALREVEHARALVRNSQNVLARMPVAIAAARIQAISNASSAIRELQSLRSEAVRSGIPRYEFDTLRAIVEIEGRRSGIGAAHAASLQKDAKARGFLLYAR